MYAELTRFDPRWQYFDISPKEWFAIVADIKLTAAVPKEVANQIEVCKKLCVYGLFVYEFLTVAIERSFPAIETALKLRYRAATGKGSDHLTLGPLLDWALSANILGGISSDMKEAIRNLRNMCAHPKNQNIDMPGSVITMLQRNVILINSIFEEIEAQ